MKRATLALGGLVLSFGLAAAAAFSQQPTTTPKLNAFPQAARDNDVPAELQSAMQKLESARNDLDHAGGDWGGFREKAISHIQEAQGNLKSAMEWRRSHR